MDAPVVSLSALLDGERARVSPDFVCIGIERIDLAYLIGDTKIPTAFDIKGLESTIRVFYQQAELDNEGRICAWSFYSSGTVKTAVGHRRVSVTVYAD